MAKVLNGRGRQAVVHFVVMSRVYSFFGCCAVVVALRLGICPKRVSAELGRS